MDLLKSSTVISAVQLNLCHQDFYDSLIRSHEILPRAVGMCVNL